MCQTVCSSSESQVSAEVRRWLCKRVRKGMNHLDLFFKATVLFSFLISTFISALRLTLVSGIVKMNRLMVL